MVLQERTDKVVNNLNLRGCFTAATIQHLPPKLLQPVLRIMRFQTFRSYARKLQYHLVTSPSTYTVIYCVRTGTSTITVNNYFLLFNITSKKLNNISYTYICVLACSSIFMYALLSVCALHMQTSGRTRTRTHMRTHE